MSGARPSVHVPVRDLTPVEKGFKVMTAKLVEECGGNGVVAQALGVSPALVSKWCALRIAEGERSPCLIPTMHLMALEGLCNVGVVSRWMTDHAETGPNAPVEVLSLEHLAEMAAEGSEAKTALVQFVHAAKGGKAGAADRETLRSECVDVIALYTRIVRALDQA
jgi:hypothetical protein